ncbi:unnamed protein product [Adineta steineri]|uniref:NAD(P)(+)--arginine ADP-ribosyltransferase n=1 Tax=Adineta steineri TaxID=433720 RepID=A0A819PL01_9BILA|nr:unnamed protein product [Adineta steineri]CAF1119421.1 unnamed protein product [Adineta steineri]CAF1188465.1 unnamed protein product [Adineta steineri]CAF3960785.1 unnamed protein product [Adineta steineri]CAF3995209.1 unnamed protein product [Adineta steineri]
MSNDDIKDTTYRFADAAREPCHYLVPIEGYSKKRLVSLEEAVKPIKHIVPRLDGKIYALKRRALNPADGLTVDESAAIALYTSEWEPYKESLYYVLNNALRAEDRDVLKPWFSYLKLLLTAISRLPKKKITIYRGIQLELETDYEKYQVGSEPIWWGFSSCSTDRTIGEKREFMGENGRQILFVIDCINGVDISRHSYFRKENEVLLLPGTTVKVIRHKKKQEQRIIYLKEIVSSEIHLEPLPTEEDSPLPEDNIPSPNEDTLSMHDSDISSLKNFTSSVPYTDKFDTVSTTTTRSNAEGLPRRSKSKIDALMTKCRVRDEIHLPGKGFNTEEISIIAEQLIIDKQCSALSLYENKMRNRGAIVISNILMNQNHNTILERLFLTDSKIGDKGAQALAEALSNDKNLTLKELCLDGNKVTDEGIEHIATMLESNRTLTKLGLALNEVRDRGLQRLAEVLTNKNKTLQVLSLERNKFRSSTIPGIVGDMLQNNKSLIKLNLSSCHLDRSTVRVLRTQVAITKTKCELILD